MSVALAIFLILFVFLLVAGMPVAWSMLAAVLSYIAVSGQWALLPVMPEKIYNGVDVFILVAIPLFLLAGEIFSEGGLARRIVDFADAAFRWVKGGIAQVAVATCILYSGITGVALGEIAALGRIFVPAMVRAGYTPAFAAAVIASASIIGPTIPPSLPIIIYGSATNVSIGGLFAAAVVPGILLGAAQMAYIAYVAGRLGITSTGPSAGGPSASGAAPMSLGRSFVSALPSIGMPFIILGGILGGVMTPTEAAGSAVFYAFVLAVVIYRTVRLGQLAPILGQSVTFSGQLLIIVGAGAALSWVLGFENATGKLAALVKALELGPLGTMLLANVVFLVLGMFIDPTTSIILFAPILAPAAAAVGIDPLHFGVVMIVNLNIGLITPPLGVSLFAAERIAQCGLNPLIRAALPFIAINLVALIVIATVPQVSLFLPRLVGF
ncbi:MAG: TRAP transporter large permease [Rhodospirillaceae bacterium]|nr:TRAP transporter large permease [Rhodospirillaceae bacterium]